MKTPKRVLVCPLDWGLGHATRCIPIIQELRHQGCDVQVASSGDALALLKIEFPEFRFYSLTGYQPAYTTGSFIFSMLRQLPGFRSVIRKEHDELERIVKENNIDLVISDNRYGCWSARIRSVIVIHQLNIQSPVFASVIRSVHRHALKRFSAVWVPDVDGENSLAGNLTEADGFPVTYVGPLSRLRAANTEKKYGVVALLSGPEPQRTILEDLLRKQLPGQPGRNLLIKGRPSVAPEVLTPETTEINFLPALALNDILAGASLVVARSGYSTIMDLSVLGGKALFIPTPGQTEQEYLGALLMKKGIALCVPQKDLNLKEAISRSKTFSGFHTGAVSSLLSNAVKTLLL